jgi:hypothetical protein
MSEPESAAVNERVTAAYDRGWVLAVAASRGLEMDAEATERLLAVVAPTLMQFAEIAGELTADDDMYEFRRLLAEEGRRG